MRSIAFSLLAVAWTVSAAAHVTSTGLATLDLDGEKLLYRLTVVATEVDDQGGRLLATAADGDRAAAERVAGFLRDYARFSIAGEACQPGRIAMRGSTDRRRQGLPRDGVVVPEIDRHAVDPRRLAGSDGRAFPDRAERAPAGPAFG